MLKHGKKFVKITLKEKDNVIVTEFINEAKNLTQSDIERLFDRFYTADKSRSDKNTGLGLCITKTLVNRLGNDIKAELKDGNLIISIAWRIK